MNLVKFTASIVIGLSVLSSSLLASNIFASNGNKITICHRHNSVTNPYNTESVDDDAVDGQGNNDHTQHTGPVAISQAVAQALKDNHQDWGDIIPNILNWTTEGQAIYNNDCKYVVASPSPSPSPSASVAVSPSPSASAVASSSPLSSPSPSASASPSVSPSVSASPSTSSSPQGGTGASSTPTPTSTPTPSSNNNSSNSSSSDNSNSNSGVASTGEVLGASTLAATGTTENLMTVLFGIGIMLMLGSSLKYAQEKK